MPANQIPFSPGSVLGPIAQNYPPFHFSVDDVFDILIEVTDKNIPLFAHPIFLFFQKMHEKHGLHIDLYLFFQKEINGKMRILSEVRDLKQELADAGGWFRFGPHALDYPTMPFDQSQDDQRKLFNAIYTEIDRFAGRDTYARAVRLHFYSELYELADYFTTRGVTTLFSTDREVGSYRMPKEIGIQLYTQGDATYHAMHFVRTQFRLEFFTRDHFGRTEIEAAFRGALKQYGYVVFYTHQIELGKREIQLALEISLDILQNLSLA